MDEPRTFGVRQYTCFCCGIMFSNYYEYSTHIISTHEEGQDYIKCPLARCSAPVRDVRLHFKAHHPSEKLPHKGQMRAIVWKDQKAPAKKKKKAKYHEGYITSIKNGNKQMHYRSGWERDVYICLENLSEISSYKVENFPVQYYWKGKTKRYFPDLFITFKDNHNEVWEIKPNNQKQLEMNKAKWLACEGHCETRGWIFKVIDENEIKRLKQKTRLEVNLLEQNVEIPKNFFDQ